LAALPELLRGELLCAKFAKKPDTYDGESLAKAGVILGWIGVVLPLIIILLALLFMIPATMLMSP
jgi:hypothetical protein